MNSISNAVFLNIGYLQSIFTYVIMLKESREFMKTIKKFLDFTNLSKEWKSALLALVISSLMYCSLYTLLMRILFMVNNAILYYMTLYLIVVFSGVVFMMILMHFLKTKREEMREVKFRTLLLPLVLVQSIYFVVMAGGSSLSLYLLKENIQGYNAILNVILMFCLMFYIPVQIFGAFHIYDGKRNPFSVIKESLQTIFTHYRSVFYSFLLIVVIVALYYSLLNAFFGMEYTFYTFSAVIDIMTMNPFMIACTYIMEIGTNMNKLMAVVFSFVYGIFICAALCLYYMFMACIHDGNVNI